MSQGVGPVELSNGAVLSYPVQLRNVTQAILTLTARTADINRLLPADLRAVDFGYGLTEIYIFWLSTIGSDFGTFSEVQVTFAATEPVFRRQSGFVFANPVTSRFAQVASREIWGVRKRLADIDVSDHGGRLRCELRMEGSHVLTIESDRLRGEHCRIDAFISTGHDGSSTVFRYRQVSGSCAHQSRPTTARLTLGEHEISDALRRLTLEETVHRYSVHQESLIMMGPLLRRGSEAAISVTLE